MLTYSHLRCNFCRSNPIITDLKLAKGAVEPMGENLVDLASKLSKAGSETESYRDSLIINSAFNQVKF